MFSFMNLTVPVLIGALAVTTFAIASPPHGGMLAPPLSDADAWRRLPNMSAASAT